MSVADATETHAEPFPSAAVADRRTPAERRSTRSTADLPRNRDASDTSVDYSRSQCSCRSLRSQYDYSEDFVSECSETAVNRTYLGKPVVKEEKGGKQKYNVRKISQPKGQKELSVEKKQNWNTSFLNSKIDMITQRGQAVTHRLLSARLNKIKELKNELTDIQRKMEATAIENQLLKQLQIRHLKAIGKYENSQNNVPQMVAKHQSEVRSLRQLLRKSKEEERTVTRKLRDTDSRLLKTKDALEALQKLAEDDNLAEREELTQRLAVLMTKMEANDLKIQSLEKQLRLNKKAFHRQLAVENQKTLAAQTVTNALQMEVRHLQRKLKEKDRELEIKNIYANRIFKNLNNKEDYPTVSSTKSVQADRKSVSFTTTRHQETQKSEDVTCVPTKDPKTTGNTGRKEKCTEVVGVTPPCISKPASPQESRRKHDNVSEEEGLVEGQPPLENAERQREKKEDQGKKPTLAKARELPAERIQALPPEREGHREGRTAKDKFKGSLQIGDTGATPDKNAAANATAPLRQRKRYSFTEAIENLHNGLPASGGPANPASSRRRHSSGRPGGPAEAPQPQLGAGGYTPSFRKSPGTNATEIPLRDKKSSLMEELFGSGCVFKNNQLSTAASNGLAGTLRSARAPHPPPSQASARHAGGDAEVAVLDSSKSSSPTEGKVKILI